MKIQLFTLSRKVRHSRLFETVLAEDLNPK